jgi:hypothetical protein
MHCVKLREDYCTKLAPLLSYKNRLPISPRGRLLPADEVKEDGAGMPLINPRGDKVAGPAAPANSGRAPRSIHVSARSARFLSASRGATNAPPAAAMASNDLSWQLSGASKDASVFLHRLVVLP